MKPICLLAILAAAMPSLALADDSLISLRSSDGTLVRMEDDASSVLIADPAIADVQLVSDRSIFVFGRVPGSTRLFVLGENDEIMLERRVIVSRTLNEVQQALTDEQVAAQAAENEG